MTTLIHSQGAGAGRCDAKCYDAQSHDCDCVCGGVNHGCGQAIATNNTKELAGALLRAVESRGGWIAEEVRQGKLFL